MKVGMITPLDPRTGVSRYSEALVHQLRKIGQDVDLISPPAQNFQKGELYERIVNIEKYNPSDYDILHFQLGNSPFHEFQLHALKEAERNSKIITTVHDTRNFDVMNLKCLNCYSLAFQEWLKGCLTYPYKWVDKYFQRISNLFIFHSIYALEEYKKMYNLKKPAEVIPIPTYIIDQKDYNIDQNKIIRDRSKKYEVRNGKYEKRLVVPGYISPFKGHDILIKAINGIKKDFKLIFLGQITDKEYETYLKNLVKFYDLKDIVEFKGFVSDEEFTLEMSKSYLIIVPRLMSSWLKKGRSYKIRKALNLEYLVSLSSSAVLAHAFALGKPVLCSNNKVFSEFVNLNTGILCDNTVESWRKGLKLILNNPNLAMEMSINSRKYADNILNPKVIADKHIKVYEQMSLKNKEYM